ncbi:MAG: LPS export ABC transporter permease LptG [Nitrospirota bacterium]|nr:LPS export ABC transporter permease LptG [Nitrospirota bacterium]
MKILNRHILAEFAKILAIAIAAFVALFLVIDVFDNMPMLVKYKVKGPQAFVFFIYKIPFIFGQTAPVAALLSTLVSLGILSKHGEITALKAGGVRILRSLVPLMMAGVFLSIAVFVINEVVTPQALARTEEMKREWGGAHASMKFGKTGFWLRTNTGFLNAKKADFTDNTLDGITIFTVDKNFAVTKRINAEEVRWTNGGWVAKTAETWTFQTGKPAKRQTSRRQTIAELDPPEQIATGASMTKNLGFFDLLSYIKTIEEEGYNAVKYRVELFGKLTFPFATLIMVIIGIPFALKAGRHSGIASGVGISVIIAFFYWILFAVTRSLGLGGVIPPAFAAAFPNIVFLAVGALMYTQVRE